MVAATAGGPRSGGAKRTSGQPDHRAIRPTQREAREGGAGDAPKNLS